MASRSVHAVRAVTVTVVAIVGFWSQAALAANLPFAVKGPLSPVHPFPLWYQDASAAPGVKIEPCLEATGCNLPAAGISAPLNTAAPIKFPNNFPSTAVYGYANIDVPVFDQTSGKLAARGLSYTAQLIATFGALGGNFDPLGPQVWTQINFVTSAKFLANQTYTIAHPYGTFTLAADATGNLCQNRNQGGRNPCDIRFPAAVAATSPFDGVLGANPSVDPNDATVGTFLKQVGAPAGFLGDGLTRSGITGSPVAQNFIRISGPGVGTSPGNACTNGATTDCIEVGGAAPPKGQGFVVAGKIFNAAGGATTQFWIADPLTANPSGAQPRIDFRGVAGTPQVLTIHAVDVNGNITAGYNGAVALTSNDPLATVPLTATLSGGTGTFTVTPHTASPASTASFAVTATDAQLLTGSGAGLVNAAPATALLVTGPGSSIAGTQTTFSVAAIDPFGNLDRSFAGTLSIGSSDPAAILPAPIPIVGGSATFNATFKKAGSVSLTVDGGVTVTPGVAIITVSPGPAASIAAVSGGGQSGTAGLALPAPFVVVVRDAFANPVPGTLVTFTPPAGGSVSASPVTTGADGQASATGTLPTLLGSYSYSASSGVLAGSPVSFTATALHGPPASLAMTGPATTTAGASALVTLAVFDQFLNPCSTFGGIVSFTTSDAAAPAPAPALIAGGLGSTAMVFHTAGTQTLNGSLSGFAVNGSYVATVNHGPASNLVLVSGNLQSFTVGLPLPQPLVVWVTDAFNNPVPGIAVSFSAVTAGASVNPPASTTAADGTAQAVATLASAVVGTQTFSATSGTLLGSPATFTATAAPAVPAGVAVTGLAGSITAGSPAAFTVTVRDQFGNVSTGFNGGVSFTSTDPAATLPAATTLSAGTGTFGATFKTAGSRTISATIATTPTLPGTSAPTVVNAGAPSSIAAVSGGGQTGVVGTALASPLVVRVQDAFLNNVPSVAVAFTASAGGSTSGPALTAADGTASVTATLPTASGAASFAGSVAGIATPASFAETAVPAAPTAVTVAGVPTPTTTAGAAFAVTVRAFDQFHNAATNFNGAVAVTSSDPAAVLPAAATFTAGVTAALPVTLKSAGARTVTATIVGIPTATLSTSTTVTAAAASTLAATAGSGQTGTVGAPLGSPFVATVTDPFGNPVSGVSVAFTAPATGSIAASAATGANGQASATGTLGHTAGAQSFTASVPGLTPAQVTFGATANAGAAATIAIVSGNNQTGTVGTALGAPFVVSVADSFGNPVAGSVVSFTAPATGSIAASVTTAANGRASATGTLAHGSGAQTFTASVAGVATPVSFAATANPGATGSIAVVSAPASATVGTAAAAASVVVKDTFGNVVPNATVTFTAPAGASIAPATATTDAQGVATATATVGTTATSYTFTATVLTFSTTFSVTATPGAAASLAIGALPASTTAGTPAKFTVTASDQFGNTATGFTGPITFASSDPLAALPGASPLVNGAGTFSATFKTAGARTLTALSAAPAMTSPPASTTVAVGVTITANKVSPQLAGTPVVFTASGIGSSGYQYRFFMKASTAAAYTMVQDYGVGSTWTLPGTAAAGTYRIVVHVRTSTSVALDAQAGIDYTLALPATGVTIAADKPSPQFAGKPVVFTASGIGSTGYQYRFFMKASTATAYTMVQDYGVGSAWTLPSSTAAGTYRIVVHVRTSTSVAFDAQAGVNYTLSTPPVPATGVTLTADKVSPQVAGTPVVFTASGIGSTGYQYRFFMKASTATAYTMVQDYGIASTWTLPSTTAAGTYRVIVHVRTNPAVTFDAQAGVNYTLSTPPPPATGVTLTADKVSPQVAGTPVVFTASGIGSTGYQYRFFMKAATATAYTMVQDYGVGSTWTLPSTTLAGTYRIVVHVRTNPAVALDTQAGVNFTLVATPTVATITPATGSSAGGDTVVITGTHFDPGVTVDFGGFFLGTVTLATPTSITVTTPPHPVGAFDVIITNPSNQSAVVLGGFTFADPVTRPPKLLGIAAATDTVAGGSTVTLSGADFAAGATVSFGGAPGTVLGGTLKSMLVTVPSHAAGAVDVTVTNPDGQSSTLVGSFTYTPVPAATIAPTIASLSVSSGPDAGGSVIVVNGTNFVAGTNVLFGGIAGIVQTLTSTSIAVATPPHAAGFVDVTVRKPDGQSATLVGAFDYVSPGPNILTLNIHGAPMAGGTPVLIAGSGFHPGASVTFGGVPGLGASYDAVNKVISVITPAGPGGAEAFVSVTITNPDGQSSSLLGFHYGPPPVASDFFSDLDGTKTLASGTAGQVIDIIGSQFSSGPGRAVQVLFVGPGAGVGTVNQALSSANTLSVAIPKLNPGVYQVFVTNFDGQFGAAPGVFTILGP